MLLLMLLKGFTDEGRLTFSGGNAAAEDNQSAYVMNNGYREIVVVNKTQYQKDVEEGNLFSYINTGTSAAYYQIRTNTDLQGDEAKKISVIWVDGHGDDEKVVKLYRYSSIATSALTLLTLTPTGWNNPNNGSAKIPYLDLASVSSLDVIDAGNLIFTGDMSSGDLLIIPEHIINASDTTTVYYLDIAASSPRNITIGAVSRPKP